MEESKQAACPVDCRRCGNTINSGEWFESASNLPEIDITLQCKGYVVNKNYSVGELMAARKIMQFDAGDNDFFIKLDALTENPPTSQFPAAKDASAKSVSRKKFGKRFLYGIRLGNLVSIVASDYTAHRFWNRQNQPLKTDNRTREKQLCNWA